MTDQPPARPPAAPRPRARPAAAKRKTKRVRWSARREDKFLQALAEFTNVAQSCRVAGLSESSVYRRRQQSEEFRTRWATALREGVVKLETLLLERALNGVEKPVWHGGKQVGTMREYSDRLALALLAAHRNAGIVAAPDALPPMPEEQVRDEVLLRLSEMNRRLGGEG